ncbi:hypothetical protein [Kineococcus arenarius]|uniref:hypothetical protein n=1 Tax=Kineococcus sp. SYSU DK007 TaxID=3383128 RepID=UPI003D7D9900
MRYGRSTLGAVGALTLIMMTLTGCGGEIHDAEDQLSEHFLDPLTSAGIAQTVESTCRYGTPVEAVWHLQATVQLQAAKQDVADVLADAGVVVEPDADLRFVWQEGTEPGGGGGPRWPFSGKGHYGWHGSISAEGEGTSLRVVFNNAEHTGLQDGIGWAEVCPGTTPGAAAGTAATS